MKLIRSLPSFQRHGTAAGVIRAMQRLFRNPARHVRGPFFSSVPGDGSSCQFQSDSFGTHEKRDAVAACASGANELFASNPGVRTAVTRALNRATEQLIRVGVIDSDFGDNYVSVSEGLGLPALRKVIGRALKNLRAAGRA